MKVLLDGEKVETKEIDPKKHRYIGMFKPADTLEWLHNHMWGRNPQGLIKCECGSILFSSKQCMEHYHGGCWDIPQYVTIEKGVI